MARVRCSTSRIAALLLLLIASFPPSAMAAPGRWALVIGNDAYTKVEPLRNAVADGRLIAAELAQAGFDVRPVVNADRRTMLREVLELARRAEGGGEAVVYFAGHGVQVANTNYLLPVDFDGSEDGLLAYEAVSLTDLSNYLLDAKARFSLMIIDACRNNPLPARRGRSLAATRGLAPASPATGQMIVFSAGNGQVALDGLGDEAIRNGIFAREFVKEMRQPNRDVRDMMLAVRESVERLAASVNHAQRPAIYDESRGKFVFHAALAAAPASPPVAGAASVAAPGVASGAPPGVPGGTAPGFKTPEMIEDEIWAAFSARSSRPAYMAYLREYPNGRYAPAARIQLEMIDLQTTAAKGGPATADRSTGGPATGMSTARSSGPAAGIASGSLLPLRPYPMVAGRNHFGLNPGSAGK